MKNNEKTSIGNNILEEKMKEEIRSRMGSDSWDFTIAYNVIQKRNAWKEKRINIWAFASFATAAVSFIIFMAGIYSFTVKSGSYSSTGSIYSYAYFKDSKNLDNDTIAGKLELTINEVYLMR